MQDFPEKDNDIDDAKTRPEDPLVGNPENKDANGEVADVSDAESLENDVATDVSDAESMENDAVADVNEAEALENGERSEEEGSSTFEADEAAQLGEAVQTAEGADKGSKLREAAQTAEETVEGAELRDDAKDTVDTAAAAKTAKTAETADTPTPRPRRTREAAPTKKSSLPPTNAVFIGIGVLLLIALVFLFSNVFGGASGRLDQKIPLQVQDEWQHLGVVGRRFYYVSGDELFATNDDGREIFRTTLPAATTDVAYGAHIYVADTADQVFVLDAGSGEVIRDVMVPGLSSIAVRDDQVICYKQDSVSVYDKEMQNFTYYHTGTPTTELAGAPDVSVLTVLSTYAEDGVNKYSYVIFSGTDQIGKLTTIDEPMIHAAAIDDTHHVLQTSRGLYLYDMAQLLVKVPLFDAKAMDSGHGKVAYVDGMQVKVLGPTGATLGIYQIDFTATEIQVYENEILVLGDTTAAVIKDGTITAQIIPPALKHISTEDSHYLVFRDGVERISVEQ